MRNKNDVTIVANTKELNRLRINRNIWEVKELARLVGYSLTHTYEVLRGVRPVSLACALSYSQLFGVDVSEIFIFYEFK